MNEQLISFETAKLAKEKGFDFFDRYYTNLNSIWHHEIESIYLNDKIEIKGNIAVQRWLDSIEDYDENLYANSWEAEYEGDNFGNKENVITVPTCTQSLLQKWLREVHDINLLIQLKSRYNWYIQNVKESTNIYDTYEEALEKGLFEALKLI